MKWDRDTRKILWDGLVALAAVAVWFLVWAMLLGMQGCRQDTVDGLYSPPAAEEHLRAEVQAVGSQAAGYALDQLGAPYSWGDESPEEGFDCSGLVWWAFNEVGVEVPRSVEPLCAYPPPRWPARGDVCCFDTSGPVDGVASHVGLYLGGHQFVHAPRTGRVVSREDLRWSYWARTFLGYRDVLHRGGENIVAIHAPHLRSLIERTLAELDEEGYHRHEIGTDAAVELLLGTAAVESRLGTYLRQLGNGPALGIYQIEPATHDWLWNRIHRRPMSRWKLEHLGYHEDVDALEWDLRYSTLVARERYLADPLPLPEAGDIQAQAAYWKRVYNTWCGSGREEDYVRLWNELVEGAS